MVNVPISEVSNRFLVSTTILDYLKTEGSFSLTSLLEKLSTYRPISESFVKCVIEDMLYSGYMYEVGLNSYHAYKK